ncbi:MAG: DUF5686 family protein [Tannerellaceae bacterium]
MHHVIANATAYENALSEYDAEIYIKGRSEILKKNFLIRFAHFLFPVDYKTKDMIFELMSHSHFISPNHFIHTFKAVNGNSIPSNDKQQEVLAFLNINAYSSTIYNEGILMPLAKNAFKLYKFSLEDIEMTDGMKIYKIRFEPKQWSPKLVCGNLFIIDGRWTIDRMSLNGSISFAEFSLDMTYNRNNYYYLLPQKADLSLRYTALGNTVATNYHTHFNYDKLKWRKPIKKRVLKKLDMTSYYKLSTDTVPIITDSTYWKQKRDIPLSSEEEQVFQTIAQKDSLTADSTDVVKYLKLTETLTSTKNFDIQTTRVKYSGFLNPFQLGYSGHNGITYRQKIRISKTFAKDRQLRFRPEIGFVFKRKEIFFSVAGDWEYKPERRGILSLSIGNSNEGYSSEIMDEINEQLKDSAFNIDDLNLSTFKHYYIELRNNFELTNGLTLFTELSYHRRLPTKKTADLIVGDHVIELISEQYNDFMPAIGLTYTPRQYYRMDGYRKEYVYSYYPTISIEFARAIPNIFNSSGDYGRIELDIHQNIPLGLLCYFRYHLSGGLYTAQRSTYFADFRYFARRNFPDSWNDHFGGVFNQLSSRWYNASDKYLQAHLMYESSFLLSQLFRKKTSKYMLSERFYFSQLWTPVIPSYTELGYGFGNYLFNIAVFAGFKKWEYQSIGLKFTFELFQ